jgi:hypothetical protein
MTNGGDHGTEPEKKKTEGEVKRKTETEKE